MAAWPQGSDYKECLQFPDRCIRIPALKQCQIEKDPRDYPRFRGGANAHVYKLTSAAGTHAFRVFLHQNDKREQRYLAIHDHLQRVRARTSALVGFEYHPRGICIDRGLYPVLLMDWVEGRSLYDWVKECVSRGNLNALRKMADRWVTLLGQLRWAEVAHGDLQQGNVMVKNDELLLVDYDCMYVPALAGQPAPERGLPGYQHPLRETDPLGQPLSLDLDHFSAWIIWLSLRALAVQPQLYQDHVVKTKNDKLLFTKEDLTEPEQSSLWTKLLDRTFPDVEVRHWAEQLRQSLDGHFGDIPAFGPDPFGKLRVACDLRPRQWDIIVVEANDLPASAPTLPPELARDVAEARRRVEALDQLGAAKARGRMRDFVAAYQPTLLDDWLGQNYPLLLAARDAANALPTLDRLTAVLKSPGDRRGLLNLWKPPHSEVLVSYTDGAQVRQEVELWLRRIRACDEFLAALRGNNSHDIAKAWQKVIQEGIHPDAEKESRRGENALKWSKRLRDLESIKATDLAEQDRLWVAAWDDDELRDCPEAKSLRPRWQQALARQKKMARLRDALEQGLPLVQTLAADPELQNYSEFKHLKPQIDQFVAALKQITALEALCKQQPIPWNDVVRQANHPDLKQCKLPIALEAIVREARERRRVRLALEQAIAGRSLRDIDAAYVPRHIDDWDECKGLVEQAQRARATLRNLNQLEEQLENPVDAEIIKTTWEECAAQLSYYTEGLAFEQKLRRLTAQQSLGTKIRSLLRLIPRPDRQIAAAWHELQQTGATHLLTQEEQIEAEVSVRRIVLIDRLKEFHAEPQDEQWVAELNGQEYAADDLLATDREDREWLEVWDESLLTDCAEADELRPRLELARERTQAWEQLRAALDTDDALHIADLAGSPLLRDYPPVQRFQTTIRQKIQHGEQLRDIIDRITTGDRTVFDSKAERDFLRQSEKAFAPYRTLIASPWLTWAIRDIRILPAQPGLKLEPGGKLMRVNWNWRRSQGISHCLVAVDLAQHFRTPAEAPKTATIQEQSFRSTVGGVAVPIPSGAKEVYVTVWPVLNLGWITLTGEPLELGPLELGIKRT